MSFLSRLEVEGAEHVSLDRSLRVALDRPATLRDANKIPVDVVVDDLSTSGCRISLDFTLPVGALVSIGIPGAGMCFARVSRVDGQQHGCAFLKPISEEQILAAGFTDTLVEGPFYRLPASAAELEAVSAGDLPPVPVYSGKSRLVAIAGTTALLWAAIAMFVLAIAH